MLILFFSLLLMLLFNLFCFYFKGLKVTSIRRKDYTWVFTFGTCCNKVNINIVGAGTFFGLSRNYLLKQKKIGKLVKELNNMGGLLSATGKGASDFMEKI